MEARDLLTALRAAGCTVTAVDGHLVVEGRYSDELREAIVTHKAALVKLLTEPTAPLPATPTAPADPAAPADPLASWRALDGPPRPPPDPSLPLGMVVAGVPIPTDAQRQWQSLRAAAACRGERFDVPYPRCRYPGFE